MVKNETYTIHASPSLMEFEFISVGPKGNISKVIQFTPTSISQVYNLGFGDKDDVTGEISDSIISNNGDSEIVLATVAHAVLIFLSLIHI